MPCLTVARIVSFWRGTVPRRINDRETRLFLIKSITFGHRLNGKRFSLNSRFLKSFGTGVAIIPK